MTLKIKKRKAIIFIDGNNWYHNAKIMFRKPRVVNLKKLSKMICENFNFELVEIRYYNSIPDIELGEENYYKHMVFLAGLKKKGVVVNTRRLKIVNSQGIRIRIEKGVDVMVAADMINLCLIKEKCDVCVLVSGDADFLPAMKLIKEQGREVITASVSRGYSRDLRSGVRSGEFRYLVLKKPDLEKCFGGYNGK